MKNNYGLNSIVEMKKQHPCGCNKFRITRVGVDIKKRIEDNKEKYLKDFSPNNTVEYQYRIGGYLAERLTNVFVEKHFKKIKTYGVKITEFKY